MNCPRFSIVIPTRNRADLLPGAVRSALGQTCRDLEIVISDNRSDDNTAEVVGRFDDRRLRYVRTRSALLMHHSWRFALRHARGAYVGFLCDDDALHPDAIACADTIIRRTGADVVVWRSCSYGLPDWPDARIRGWIRFGPPYSARAWEIDGGRLVDLAYDLRVTFSELVPKMLNGVVSRALIARIRADGTELFHPSSPDYSAMLVLAANARRIVLLDAPLLVAGATARSIGASTLRGYDSARAYGAQLCAREPDLVVPAAVGPRIAWLAQTYMQCARDVPCLRERAVNPIHLYGLSGRELNRAEEAGIDAGDSRARHEAALEGPLADDRAAIEAFARGNVEIESETFLAGTVGSESGLAAEPFILNDIDLEGTKPAGAHEVAADLDRLRQAGALGLSAFWKAVFERAASRRVILYGLGRNGRALLRASRDLRPEIACCDDHAQLDDALGVPKTDCAELDPAAHYVCVTMNDAAPVAGSLATRGFARGRDWSTMREISAMAARGTSVSAGVQYGRRARVGSRHDRMVLKAAQTRETSSAES
ncbi:MAG: glycosyltransferase [Planctomycetota bacterium]|nr:glycosyltransferase [Planctomycetota bacterium]